MKGLRKKPSADRHVPKRMKDNIRNQHSMWHKKQEKKEEQETRSSEYPNTKICSKILHQKISAVSRI